MDSLDGHTILHNHTMGYLRQPGNGKCRVGDVLTNILRARFKSIAHSTSLPVINKQLNVVHANR